MATLNTPQLQMQKIETSGGTKGRVNYSVRLRYGRHDVRENLWHHVHISLWERDGSARDHIDASFNGSTVRLHRVGNGANDDYIAQVDSRWVRPDGNWSEPIDGHKDFTPSQLHEESGKEEYYLFVAAHPWSASSAETRSAEDRINF